MTSFFPVIRLREAQRGLDSLRAARIELSAVDVAGSEIGQHLDEHRAILGGEAADVNLRDLLLHGGDVLRMRVAEAGHADSGHEVDESVAVDIEEQRAFAMIDADLAEEREALRAGREVQLLLVEYLTRFGARNPQWRLDIRHVYLPGIRMK